MTDKISKSIDINAAPSVVFQALTEPSEIKSHFPFERVESDKCEGGEYICYGTFNEEPFTDFGSISVFETDRAFAYRYWSTNHGTQRTRENEISIRYDFSQFASGTRLQVTQENMPSADYAAVMDGVWDHMLGLLKSNIEGTVDA